MTKDIENIQREFGIVGREEELGAALLAAKNGKHILLEGEVGIGKTTIANAIAAYTKAGFIRVDGDERFDENKLVGFFDPPTVIRDGYSWKSFTQGPLASAMEKGCVLFINELNRIPEGTQNVLLPAMDDKLIEVPKLGQVKAKDGFLIVATQNPEEHVGVTSLAEALKDRFILITLEYQNEEEEVAIVKNKVKTADEVVKAAVRIVRKTRDHPDIKRGASIRGAIDLCTLLPGKPGIGDWVKTAKICLGTRVALFIGAEKTREQVITEIVESYFRDFP